MSNPYSSPFPDSMPKPSVPPSRPASATVFGILNLVFAGLGLCGVCFGLIPLLGLMQMPNQPPNPVFELMEENEAYKMFTFVTMGLGFIATCVLGIAGIGLLKMQAWGRQLSIVYAVYAILAAIVGFIANWFWLIGPLMERANQMGPGPEQAAAIGGAIGGTVGGCFGVIYPIILLIFMMRPSFAQAFRTQ
jgi:hypothetical protein